MHPFLAMLAVAVAAAAALWPATASTAALTAIGLKGGLSGAREHGDFAPDQYRLGFGAGAFATLSITTRFALQPELLFVMKGGKFPDIGLTDGGGQTIGIPEVTHVVDYLEIPLLVQLRIPTSGRVSPMIVCGPSMAFKLREQYHFGGPQPAESRDADFFLGTDLGFAIGAGVEIGRGRDHLLLEARYTAGVINAMNDSNAPSTRNGAFLMMAGYSMQR